MTTDEKKLLQAKHRLEEAEMRDRNKERKARTRRLIQEGAILEKVFPIALKRIIKLCAVAGGLDRQNPLMFILLSPMQRGA